jgi:serine/threonine protein kinase
VFSWKLLFSRSGLVALYSVSHSAFLLTDLSLHKSPSADDGLLESIPACLWLFIPIPLKCEEGQPDGYCSVTKLLHWGHNSAVLLTESSSFREPCVVKSIPCSKSPLIRRIDSLLYQANMPTSPISNQFLCPVLSKATSLSPSFFYVQKLCFRSLLDIFEELAADANHGHRHLPLPLSLRIIRRVIDIVSAVHALGYVLLDATPTSFCESQRGQIASLQLTDMKNATKLEPMTYSTPPSFTCKSGGRFGVPTGLFAMVSQPSLFLSHLEANCFFAAPEVLQTPGSISNSADVFSIACIFVWCTTGVPPCALVSPEILSLSSYSDQARALIPQLISSIHKPTHHGDGIASDSSAASRAITKATEGVPALTELVLAALSFVREQRPGLADFSAGVDLALAHLSPEADQ